MAVTILCPKLTCRAVLRVPDDVRGQRIRCGECGTAFVVPNVEKQRPRPPAEDKDKDKSKPKAGTGKGRK